MHRERVAALQREMPVRQVLRWQRLLVLGVLTLFLDLHEDQDDDQDDEHDAAHTAADDQPEAASQDGALLRTADAVVFAGVQGPHLGAATEMAVQ